MATSGDGLLLYVVEARTLLMEMDEQQAAASPAPSRGGAPRPAAPCRSNELVKLWGVSQGLPSRAITLPPEEGAVK